MTTNLSAKPSTKQQPQNGVATQVPAAVIPPSNKVDEPTKKELPSIQKRLAKLQELNKICERREQLADAMEELNDFFIAPTGTGCNLRFQDSKGKTFTVTNSSVIGEMVELSKKKLQTELDLIDAQLDFTI